MSLEILPTTSSVLAAKFGEPKEYWDGLLAMDGRPELCGFPFADGGTAWTSELHILAALCGHLKPEVAVESGVFRGETLRAARLLHKPRVHLAFDCDPQCASAVASIDHYTPEDKKVKFLLTDWRHIGDLWPVGERWNFAFIDSEHTAAAVYSQLNILKPLAAENAVVVVHDCDPRTSEGVTDGDGFSMWAANNANWRCFLLDTPARLGVAWKT